MSMSASISLPLGDVRLCRRFKERLDCSVGRVVLLLVEEDFERRGCERFADLRPPVMQFTSCGKYIIIELQDTANISNIWSSTSDHKMQSKAINYSAFFASAVTQRQPDLKTQFLMD
jgi:hypothetical protein